MRRPKITLRSAVAAARRFVKTLFSRRGRRTDHARPIPTFAEWLTNVQRIEEDVCKPIQQDGENIPAYEPPNRVMESLAFQRPPDWQEPECVKDMNCEDECVEETDRPD